ncbi:UNVERIFIED_CONTAM: Polygalacturonase [Sesamum calycinum]|uniref:Polygalacturonase n=1 Tax=Sesamum calycinum TaxID=2727403 RepID=A0AAW2MK48_9LAMI
MISLFGGNKHFTAQEIHTTARPNQNRNHGNFIFNVLDYGATGDGTTNDAEVDGKIVAPLVKSEWEKLDSQWILFEEVSHGITIRGSGVIEGHGESWWSAKDINMKQTDRPHAIRIERGFNVTVTGIQIQNSPKFHIFIYGTQYLRIFNFSTSSPADSPNTDSIHISNVQHVEIHDSNLACGNYPNTLYHWRTRAKQTEAQVSDIAVFDSTVQDTLTGVRIKTWQGGYGSVRDVRFSNIKTTNVKTPIAIDQNYCGGSKICNCTNDTNAVAITGLVYENITGTYTSTSVSLNCSEYEPCRNLTMAIINIVASEGSMQVGDDKVGAPYCENAYGRVLTSTTPPLQDCLLPEATVPPQAVGLSSHNSSDVTPLLPKF